MEKTIFQPRKLNLQLKPIPIKRQIQLRKKTKAPEVQKEGWVLEENHWRFYENNAPVLNWKKIQGKWYYFDKNGIMLSDTIYDGYILTSSGAMVDSGWGKVKDKWYYAKPSGKISQQKWEKVGGVWYYFDKDGIMLTGKQEINGVRYYLNASGAMQTGWKWQDNSWYFYTNSGAMKRVG